MNKLFILLFLTIALVLIISLKNTGYALDPCCDRASETVYTQILVDACIGGSSPATSVGFGDVEGHLLFGGICVGTNYMEGIISSQYRVYLFGGPVDHTYSHTFSKGETGNKVHSGVTKNLCDGNTVGVTALLYGGCGY